MKGVVVRAMVPPSVQADAVYVLKDGEVIGPFTSDELQTAVANGRLSADDLAQSDETQLWQPIRCILGEEQEDAEASEASSWSSILKLVWLQFTERPLSAGAMCVAVGAITMALARWPFVFWIPWFGIAAAATLMLVVRQRIGQAILLFVGIICTPPLLFVFGPRSIMPFAIATPPNPASPVETGAQTATANLTSGLKSGTDSKPITSPAVSETSPPPLPPAPQPATLANVPEPKPLPSVPAASIPAPTNTTPPESSGIEQKTGNPIATITGTTGGQLPAVPPPASTVEGTPSIDSDAAVSDFLQKHTDAFVMVNGRDGSGSGFICNVGSQSWLFTNIHVVAGVQQPQFTRIDGTSVALGTADLAVGHDIMRFAVTQPPAHPLEAMTDFVNNVRIGDEVVVLGNSGGGGVVTNIKGAVVGLGPDRIEVSAEFIPGNSGSPIIHVKTGKVIGVATYLTKRYEEFTNGSSGSTPPSTPAPSTPPPRYGGVPPQSTTPQSPSIRPPGQGAIVIRRFAYRIDSVRTWEPLNWALFRQEGEQMRQISLLTEDIFNFLKGLRSPGEPDYHTDTLRRPASQWLTVIRSQRVSAADRLRATETFLRTLRSMARFDVAAAEGRLRYNFFRENLRSEREIRDRLYEAFDNQAKRMSSPSERLGG